MPWKNDCICQLKRKCRKSERLWRKTKLIVHLEILLSNISEYTKTVCSERQIFYSKMINENSNNPRKLFSTIDCLLNNKPANCLDQPSLIMCEDFVIFFNNKITQIRTDIAHTDQFLWMNWEVTHTTKWKCSGQ